MRWIRRARAGRFGRRTERWRGILSQDRFWWDLHGRRHRLSEMPLPYLLNVLNLLDRRAPALYALERRSSLRSPGYAVLDPRRQPEAVTWLHRTPLWTAVSAQAATRVFGHPLGTEPESDR
jgi:hypothetical protein